MAYVRIKAKVFSVYEKRLEVPQLRAAAKGSSAFRMRALPPAQTAMPIDCTAAAGVLTGAVAGWRGVVDGC